MTHHALVWYHTLMIPCQLIMHVASIWYTFVSLSAFSMVCPQKHANICTYMHTYKHDLSPFSIHCMTCLRAFGAWSESELPTNESRFHDKLLLRTIESISVGSRGSACVCVPAYNISKFSLHTHNHCEKRLSCHSEAPPTKCSYVY